MHRICSPIVAELVSLSLGAPVCALPPIWEANFGPELGDLDQSDESERTPIALPFDFPFGGSTYSTAYVYVGGKITLGQDDELNCCPEPSDILENEVPIIAPFWTNLSTEDGGEIYYNEFAEYVAVTWIGVRSDEEEDVEYDFQLQLHRDGVIVFGYGDGLFISENSLDSELVVGVSAGDDPTAPQQSFTFDIPFSAPSSTIYEYWPEEAINFLLDNRNVIFIPVGDGYDVADAFTRYQIDFIPEPPLNLEPTGDSIRVAVSGLPEPLIDSESATLFIDDGESIEAVPLAQDEPGVYAGDVPELPCGELADYWLTFDTRFGDTIRRPIGSPGDAYPAIVSSEAPGILFGDTFESDMGWTTELDSPQGEAPWTRGVPPMGDASGSGLAYFSDHPSPFTTARLISPPIEIAPEGGWLIYSRWLEYLSTAMLDEGEHFLEVEITYNDGLTWQRIELAEPNDPLSEGGWATKAIPLPEPESEQLRVRFTLEVGNPSTGIVAGVDNVRVVDFTPAEGTCPTCFADITGDGFVGSADLFAFETAIESSDPVVDFVEPIGTVDFVDAIAFFDSFANGCPD